MFVFEKETLASDLKKSLIYHKLTGRKAAKEIGISHSTIYRVLNKEEMTITTFMKLLNWFNKNALYYIKYQNDKQ